jgi:hypothetical protein
MDFHAKGFLASLLLSDVKCASLGYDLPSAGGVHAGLSPHQVYTEWNALLRWGACWHLRLLVPR